MARQLAAAPGAVPDADPTAGVATPAIANRQADSTVKGRDDDGVRALHRRLVVSARRPGQVADHHRAASDLHFHDLILQDPDRRLDWPSTNVVRLPIGSRTVNGLTGVARHSGRSVRVRVGLANLELLEHGVNVSLGKQAVSHQPAPDGRRAVATPRLADATNQALVVPAVPAVPVQVLLV